MKTEFLARVPLFAALEPHELTQLLENVTETAIRAGEWLFRRGDRGDALYVVQDGLLEAVIDEGTPSERTLNTLFAGDFVGEMALLTQEPRSASVRALIDSRLIRLSQDRFVSLLEKKPAVALHLSKVLSSYLARTNTRLSRRKARIGTVIPIGRIEQLDALAAAVAASLERQFGVPAVVAVLGDPGLTGVYGSGESAEAPSDVPSAVVPLPAGGHVVHLGERLLERMDDHAMAAVIDSLRLQFGHVVVWMRPSEALKRISILTRFDRTFIAAGSPFDGGELSLHGHTLAKVMKGRLRIACLASRGQALPAVLPSDRPPIRVTIDASGVTRDGADRLARAIAGATVGLALGSGTAQGLAHLGVMKAMIEADLPIDLIAGTSGGALYGSMIASGLSIDESVRRVIHHTRRNLVDKLDFTVPRRGIIRGGRIERMVQSVIGDLTFADLAIPLYAVAADLETGEEVVIRDGPVYRGVRASISVPGIFEPYSLLGRTLVDGVVVNPLPVSVARSMGADIVVAVQVPAPGKVNMEASARSGGGRRQNGYNIVSAVVRSHHFVGDRLADKSAAEADVFVKPDVTGYGWREYRAAPDIIEAGVQAGRAAAARIAALIKG